jgi:hypothetical protein
LLRPVAVYSLSGRRGGLVVAVDRALWALGRDLRCKNIVDMEILTMMVNSDPRKYV